MQGLRKRRRSPCLSFKAELIIRPLKRSWGCEGLAVLAFSVGCPRPLRPYLGKQSWSRTFGKNFAVCLGFGEGFRGNFPFFTLYYVILHYFTVFFR